MHPCFSAETRIVLSNGDFKMVKDLNPGDKVFNLKMEEIKVTKVVECEEKQKMHQILYKNSYTPIYLSADQKVLGESDDKDKLNWLCASDLEAATLSFPEGLWANLSTTFEVKVGEQVLKPTFELGNLVGLYCGYGSIIDKKVDFRFGPNNELLKQVGEFFKNIFKAETTVVKDEYCYQITCADKEVLAFFEQFGDKMNRVLPKIFWANDEEYIRGLFEGLVEYVPEQKLCRYIAVSEKMAQVFDWICTARGIVFENNVIINKDFKVFTLHVKIDSDGPSVIEVKHDNIEERGWYVSVDCPTNTILGDHIVLQTVTNNSDA